MRALLPRPSFRERTLLLTAVTLFFVAVYFGSQLITRGPPVLVTWDFALRIPNVSAFVVVYASAYVVPGFLLFAPLTRSDFRRLILAYAIAIALSAPWFVLMPLVPPHATLGSGAFDSVLAFIYATDVHGNCFPSLHVSLAFLTALATGRSSPRYRRPMLAWASAVAVSTVLVHQHYVVDVLGGVLYAGMIWKIVFKRLASD